MARRNLLLACLALLGSLLAGRTEAQGLIVRNERPLEYTVVPGQVITGTLLIDNTAETQQNVVIYLSDYRTTDNDQAEMLPAGTLRYSAGGWTSLSANALSIPARDRVRFNFTTTVPADSLEGGASYTTLIFVETLPAGVTQTNLPTSNGRIGIRIQEVFRIGTRLTFHAAGSPRHAMAIIDKGLLADSLEHRRYLEVRLDNEGNTILKPTLSCEIFDAAGALKAKLPSRETALTVYPEYKQRAMFDVTSLEPGAYTAVVIADAAIEDLFGAQIPLTIPAGKP